MMTWQQRKQEGKPVTVLGVDPGPVDLGWALYERVDGRPLVEAKVLAHGVDDVGEWHRTARAWAEPSAWARWHAYASSMASEGTFARAMIEAHVIAVERVQSYGISGASLLRTAEVGGALMHEAGPRGRWIDRATVKRGLGVAGAKGSADAAVRQRLIELHGGSREVAIGRKASPGPLYGLKSHAWAALAVAVVARDTLDTEPGPSFGGAR